MHIKSPSTGMREDFHQEQHGGAGAADCNTTHWSVVLRAGQAPSTAAHQALDWLCQRYWYPLYAFARRSGHRPEDAKDLTQGFFAHLIEKHALAKVDQALGKFRTFLLSSFRNFMANELDRARARKRGGGCSVVSLDAVSAEERFSLEPADPASPDRVFERNWALALMEQALTNLRMEQARAGKSAQFDLLQPCLMSEADAPRHAELADMLGIAKMESALAVEGITKLAMKSAGKTK